VLIGSVRDSGHPGASNAPADTADATCHAVTPPTSNRDATDPAAALTAATASPSTDPAGSGSTTSTATRTASLVKNTRTGSARPANRRSHPRTVSGKRPRSSAILRCPRPSAAFASADPITSTSSARRTKQVTGNNTCVRRHPAGPEHRARRGCTCAEATTPRTSRTRARPQGRSASEHPGHRTPPAASRRSTLSGSASTVTTGASVHHERPSRVPAKGITGGPLPSPTSSP